MPKIFIEILTSVVIFFALTFSSHAMFGKGEIKIDSSFKEGYQGYLQAMKEEKGWTGAFAADNDGAWGWFLAAGPDDMTRARQGAIKSCNESSSTNSCRLFARNNKIFWKWNGLPDMSFDASKFVDPNEINVTVGKGNVYLSYYTKQAFDDYKSSCKAWEKEKPDHDIYCYFAISSNGTKYGSEIQSVSKAGRVASNVENNVKASAVADCMEQNNKKQCYLYAMKGEVIWENSQPANTSSTPVDSTTSVESNNSISTNNIRFCQDGNGVVYKRVNVFCDALNGESEINKKQYCYRAKSDREVCGSDSKEKLLELKSLLDEGLITQDQYDKKSNEILESL